MISLIYLVIIGFPCQNKHILYCLQFETENQSPWISKTAAILMDKEIQSFLFIFIEQQYFPIIGVSRILLPSLWGRGWGEGLVAFHSPSL